MGPGGAPPNRPTYLAQFHDGIVSFPSFASSYMHGNNASNQAMGPNRGVSLSARERNNPPPRRKACTACIRAKRRCDLAVPCLRCDRRGIPCEYANQRVAAEYVDVDVDMSALDTPPLLYDDAPNFITEPDEALYTGQYMLESADPMAPMDLMAPTTAELYVQSVITRKLQFALEEIRDAPRRMIMESQTPWSHALLYSEGMPKSMRGASFRFSYFRC